MESTNKTMAGAASDTLPGAQTQAGDEESPKAAASEPRLPDAGTSIGRYIVLSKLGTGAMGVVLSAYDPDLDRNVALKLLKPLSHKRGETARARLQREAQALAKLNHPNVVSVYDVGLHDDQVFVAMELVRGQTLREWMKPTSSERPPGWREVVDVFMAAGAGLAAAHGRGLLHRDFKPDNVMIGADEEGGLDRVRVMDFGLARNVDAPSSDLPESDLPTTLPSDEEALTRTGALLGTPGYMAPEIFAGSPATARSDQFAFCVSLFEVLFGSRPFSGRSLLELAASSASSRESGRGPLEPETNPSVPRWLRAVIHRGLSTDPEQRFEDMNALLAAIRAGERKAVRLRRAGVMALAGLSVLGLWGAQQWSKVEARRACQERALRVDAAWNDEARRHVRDGLMATGKAYAEATVKTVLPYLDSQASALAQAERKACRNARVEKIWSAELEQRASACLDARRTELAALVDVFQTADDGIAQGAVSAAAALSSVDPCLDEHRLGFDTPPSGDDAAVAAIRAALGRVDALTAAGKYADALTEAQPALAEAEDSRWPPLVAAAKLRTGLLLGNRGNHAEARAALEDAFFLADRHASVPVQADAAIALVRLVGVTFASHDDGHRWVRHAENALAELGEPADGIRRAALQSARGSLFAAQGRYEDARAAREEALAIRRAAVGSDHPAVADSLDALAESLRLLGKMSEIEPLREESLAIRRHALGDEHPAVADSMNGLGRAAADAGNSARALELYRRALDISVRELGPDHLSVANIETRLGEELLEIGLYDDSKRSFTRALQIRRSALGHQHPKVGESLSNLATLHYRMAEYDKARALFSQTLSIQEKHFDPENPRLALVLANLGAAVYQQGRYEEALEYHSRALAIQEQQFDSDHPDLALVLENLAFDHVALGNFDEAHQLAQRALSIAERAWGPSHLQVAYSLEALARAAHGRGQDEEAIRFAQRAFDVRDEGGAAPDVVAESEFALAQFLWAAPTNRAERRRRAIEHARAAREQLRSAALDVPLLATIDEWIDKHDDHIATQKRGFTPRQ